MSAKKVHVGRMVRWLIAGSLLGVTGCSEEADEVLLDTEPLWLKVYERVSNNNEAFPPELTLQLATKRSFHQPPRLLASVDIQGNNIRVTAHSIQDINHGTCCFSGSAKFQSMLDVPEGDYELEIITADDTDQFALSISDSMIQLVPVEASFVSAMTAKLYRYPKMSFFYTCRTTPELAWMCEAFAARLESNLTLEQHFFSDSSAWWPYPRGLAGGSNYIYQARYYRYLKRADYESIGALMKQFNESAITESTYATLIITNWRWEYFYSWLFD